MAGRESDRQGHVVREDAIREHVPEHGERLGLLTGRRVRARHGRAGDEARVGHLVEQVPRVARPPERCAGREQRRGEVRPGVEEPFLEEEAVDRRGREVGPRPRRRRERLDEAEERGGERERVRGATPPAAGLQTFR